MATFSPTEILDYMRCRRKWNYSSSSLQSLGPLAPVRSLSLGTNVHAALAQWLIEPEAKLRDLFLVSAADNLAKIKAAYRKQVGAGISDSELAPFYDGQMLGEHMMDNYQTFWGSPLLEGFVIVEPEQKFVIPIPGTNHSMSMRLDGLIERTKYHTLFILEHKTYSSRPRLSTLENAFQFLAYTWGARQVFGKKVEGVAYDGMWSRAVPPKGSKMEDLFMRLLIERSDYAVNGFSARLKHQVNEMAVLVDLFNNPATTQEELDAAFYEHRRWQGCFDDSSFDEMCAMHTNGEDYKHYCHTHFVKLTVDKEFVDTDDE